MRMALCGPREEMLMPAGLRVRLAETDGRPVKTKHRAGSLACKQSTSVEVFGGLRFGEFDRFVPHVWGWKQFELE